MPYARIKSESNKSYSRKHTKMQSQTPQHTNDLELKMGESYQMNTNTNNNNTTRRLQES